MKRVVCQQLCTFNITIYYFSKNIIAIICLFRSQRQNVKHFSKNRVSNTKLRITVMNFKKYKLGKTDMNGFNSTDKMMDYKRNLHIPSATHCMMYMFKVLILINFGQLILKLHFIIKLNIASKFFYYFMLLQLKYNLESKNTLRSLITGCRIKITLCNLYGNKLDFSLYINKATLHFCNSFLANFFFEIVKSVILGVINK